MARHEAVVVACAEQQAPGRVRRLAVRKAEKVQPEALTLRHERAVAERHVRVTPLPDGMAELAAVLPAAVAHGIHDRLTRMAHAHAQAEANQAPCPAGMHRNVDQLRADLLSDVLLRGAPTGHDTPDGLLAAITARAAVTVPVLNLIDGGTARAAGNAAAISTTAGNAEQVPADMDGRHPIDPGTARILAGQAAAWNRVLTDPFTGAVLSVDRYRPSEELKRLLTSRDSRCRFPGCGIKARDLDVDHTQDAALGGPTETGNQVGLCRRHHTLKHRSPWKTRQAGAGVLEWTSPTGRTYVDHPPIPATHTGVTVRTQRRVTADHFGPGNTFKPPPFDAPLCPRTSACEGAAVGLAELGKNAGKNPSWCAGFSLSLCCAATQCVERPSISHPGSFRIG
ncbi:HNH endonuclease signature motif containing protein [Arthrobacter sp. CJ23]|uniref:HNH endonuclease signature motif containing protein n=1 Tax=Arthrobacter sp. CJ23 TaxID=2972479 RepID=UPI00215CE610|nr:HNH endonuclease signature motif containing protein [Arthrobacter sp. CJ23]UVJ41023.1 HNH endonuclease [Arthrobacter sp. CJ23]